MRCVLKYVVAILMAVSVVGCGIARMPHDAPRAAKTTAPVSPVADSTRVQKLYKSNRCENISRGGFILVRDSVALADLLAPLGKNAVQSAVSQVDFNRHNVLVVDFGAQPTAEVKIGLAADNLELSADKAIVRVSLPERNTAKRQAQMLSHPCELLVVPKAGQRTLEIRSQFDDLLTDFPAL